MTRRLLTVAATGTGVTAICCVTPLLPFVLGAVGAGSLTGFLYRDSVLLPVLGAFVLLTLFALWRRKRG